MRSCRSNYLNYDHVNQLPEHDQVRDRPFNLKGGRGLWLFVSFRIFFFCRAKRECFFPEFNIRLYDKNSESDFFFLHQNQNIFFSNIGNPNIFLEKKHTPPLPLQVKWSFPKPTIWIIIIANNYLNHDHLKQLSESWSCKQTTWLKIM